MKCNHLPLLCLLLFIYACGNSKKEIPPTIIKGKITSPKLPKTAPINTINYTKIQKRRKEISLTTSAIRSGLGVPNHQAQTDAEGNYHFLIYLQAPTEIRLNHLFKDVSLYAKPGDELIVDFDWSKEGNPHFVKGDNLVMNQLMSDFDQLFRDSFQIELRATLPYAIPREFKEQRASITKRIRRVADDFIEKHAKNNPILADWVKHHSEYRIAMDYMKYAFKVYGFNEFSPDLKEGFPKAYFDFWEEFPVNNPTAFSSLNYQNYLQLYQKYLMSMLRQTTTYQDCKQFPNCNEFELEIAQLGNQLEGKIKDLVLSQQADFHLIRNNQHFLEKGFPLYLNALSDSTLATSLLARKAYLYEEKSFEIPENVQLIQSDATGDEVQKTIAAKYPNRPVILYFWNTQRNVVLYYENKEQVKKTWLQLDSLGIDLVMLAHHSTPNIWQETVIETAVIGDQWHLTDEQFDYFQDYFEINRKTHRNYDRIRDRENFILILDETGNLSTLNSIRFREASFSPVSFLPYLIRIHQQEMARSTISTGN